MNLHFGQDIFASINFQAASYFNQRYTIKDKEQPLVSEDYIKFIKEIIKILTFGYHRSVRRK